MPLPSDIAARKYPFGVTPDDVQSWLDAYIAAWRSYDSDSIAGLFTEDATYAYRPWDDPVDGVDAIVAAWVKNLDAPDSWEAEYRPLLVAGDRAITVGETHYANGETYANLWVLSFDARGKCREFVEWYMEKPVTGG